MQNKLKKEEKWNDDDLMARAIVLHDMKENIYLNILTLQNKLWQIYKQIWS